MLRAIIILFLKNSEIVCIVDKYQLPFPNIRCSNALNVIIETYVAANKSCISNMLIKHAESAFSSFFAKPMEGVVVGCSRGLKVTAC